MASDCQSNSGVMDYGPKPKPLTKPWSLEPRKHGTEEDSRWLLRRDAGLKSLEFCSYCTDLVIFRRIRGDLENSASDAHNESRQRAKSGMCSYFLVR